MKERGVRDQMVLATKFTTCFPNPNNAPRLKSNYGGNRYVTKIQNSHKIHAHVMALPAQHQVASYITRSVIEEAPDRLH
jgi:aryl-alcohol dehydrogenase-like predicted oxidoreductase